MEYISVWNIELSFMENVIASVGWLYLCNVWHHRDGAQVFLHKWGSNLNDLYDPFPLSEMSYSPDYT